MGEGEKFCPFRSGKIGQSVECSAHCALAKTIGPKRVNICAFLELAERTENIAYALERIAINM